MYQFIEKVLTRLPIILQAMRFGAIGFLNTALDFAIFNFLSSLLGVIAGVPLGAVNIIGFLAASTQSYFWNRYWTFGNEQQHVNVIQNFHRLIGIGAIGVLTFLSILIGANFSARPLFYLLVLILFIGLVAFAWVKFDLHKQVLESNAKLFIIFVVISAIGLLINSLVIALLSLYLLGFDWFATHPDLAKNASKIVAVAISLIWNFVGYKLIVFRK